MNTRALPVGVLTVGLAVGMAVGLASPAAAQGHPVGGTGNRYFLAGAGNITGQASVDFAYGDPGDEVYFGDFVDETGAFGGDGRDDAMVRRGNAFIIRGQDGRVFHYGDPGDVVLVGDWDGDGTDTLAVRRGNRYFVKNDIDTGVADYDFFYGDPGDTVLVGNWDGDTSAESDEYALVTDTLTVRRGNHLFVKNDTSTGVADYVAEFGNPGDVLLVGDWALPPVYGDDPSTPEKETTYVVKPGISGDYADQFAVRRGNVYYLSKELASNTTSTPRLIGADAVIAYGDATDTAFTALLDYTYDDNGTPHTLFGDGLAVRR
jgi:hypothetical protein